MKIKYPGMVLILTLSGAIHAAPTLYPDKINTDITNVTDSDYLVDSEDQRRYYVLPPKQSRAKVRNLNSITANIGFCREIANLQRYNRDTVDLLNSLKAQEDDLRSKIDEQNLRLSQANEEISQFTAANNIKELADLDEKIRQLNARLDILYNRQRNCKTDCEVLKPEIENTQVLLMELTTKRFELSSANLFAVNQYETKKTRVQVIEKNLQALLNEREQLQANLKDLYYEFNKMYDAHAKREGARITIDYESRWQENVSRLNRDNPYYRFEKIQTKNVKMSLGAYADKTPEIIGSVISFQVGGYSSADNVSMSSFPEAFSGNAVLSLLGACPLVYPELFGLTATQALENLNFGLILNYEYPSVMKFEVTAKYNMYRAYELIKSQGKSGGFFSSHSWSNQSEEEFFRDSFSVDWKIQDEKYPLSAEDKLAINSDLRRQMLTRLAGYLVMNDPKAKTNLSLPDSTTGALVLSDSLTRVCPHFYCKGAAIVLNIMQSIFGSAAADLKIKQMTDVDMIERYGDSSVVMQPMLTSFR